MRMLTAKSAYHVPPLRLAPLHPTCPLAEPLQQIPVVGTLLSQFKRSEN